jgi:hypothetical protein
LQLTVGLQQVKEKESFDLASSPNSDIINYVISHFVQAKVEFIRAPYSSLPQLAYLCHPSRNFIHAIHAPSDILLWDVERFVVSLDLENNSYNWVDKSTVLSDLRVKDDLFIDLCLISGWDNCSTFPPFADPFNFKYICEAVRQVKSGFTLIQQYIDHPQVNSSDYVDMYCRAKCIIKFHFVMHDDGVVKPMNLEGAPNDLHDIIGHRLPNALYFYLTQGLINPQVINTLLSGYLIEFSPLCNGETKDYKNLLKDLLPLRTQTLHFLSHNLHTYYRQRKVVRFILLLDTSLRYIGMNQQ